MIRRNQIIECDDNTSRCLAIDDTCSADFT
jgi:hypothetical protein